MKIGMRSLVALAALALSSVAASAGQPGIDGFYLGMTTGLVSMNAKADTTALGATTRTNLGNQGFVGGLIGGYGAIFDGSFYGGLEGGFNLENVSAGDGALTTQPSLRRSNDGYVAARGGYLFSKQTMAYGLVGWNWSQFKLSDSTGNQKKLLNGAKVGVGVEQVVTSNITARLGYDADFDNGTFTTGATTKANVVTHEIKIGGAYHF